jgi:mono/diheme cytochrome c family protein
MGLGDPPKANLELSSPPRFGCSIGAAARCQEATLKFLIGLVVGLLIIPLAICAYFLTGSAPVATSAQPLPFERMLAHVALNARVEKEMPKNVPIAADESSYVAGAQVYRQHCAICHSLADGIPSPIAKGMFPKPPALLVGMGVTDDEPGETYWKVANGIRLTGMPAFRQSLSETEMWQVSLLLAHADKLPERAKQIFSAGPVPPPAGALAPGRTNP